MSCKSPTHKRYGNAVEGLYIQAWIADRDLSTLLQQLGDGDAAEKGKALATQQHKLDEVVERIQFGQSELKAAERAVDAHFDKGCRNVQEALA